MAFWNNDVMTIIVDLFRRNNNMWSKICTPVQLGHSQYCTLAFDIKI